MIMQNLIQKKMHALMGLSKNGARKLPPLPAPLPPGTPCRESSTGDRLFNPEWDKAATHPLNREYLIKAVSLVIEDESVSHKFHGFSLC